MGLLTFQALDMSAFYSAKEVRLHEIHLGGIRLQKFGRKVFLETLLAPKASFQKYLGNSNS